MSLFLTSTDTNVISAVESNTSGRRAFREEASAWAETHGADGYFPSSFVGRWSVIGLPANCDQMKLTGRWTKPDHHGRIKPFQNNVAEIKAMRAIRFIELEVPGLPATLDSVAESDGRHFLMYPTPILHAGAAWVCYSHRPAPGEFDKVGPQWHECLASAYHAALEAVRA